MAAEQEQSPNLLDFNNKQENNGTNNRGRLTAHEFNQLINAVNNNSNDTFSFKKQVGNLSFDVIEMKRLLNKSNPKKKTPCISYLKNDTDKWQRCQSNKSW